MAINGRDEDGHECEVQTLQRQFCPMLSWVGCTGARAEGMNAFGLRSAYVRNGLKGLAIGDLCWTPVSLCPLCPVCGSVGV